MNPAPLTSQSRPSRIFGCVAVASMAVGALALSSCAGSPASTSGSKDGSILKIGLSSEPPRLAAGGDQGTAALVLNSIMQRGLLTYDDNGNVVDGLTKSHRQVNDTTLEFHLRKGLTFQDGSPLTSENVKKSLEYLAVPDHSARIYSAAKDIAKVETPDESTAIIKLKTPNAAFLDYLADPTAAILPDAALKPGVANTLGAGPFKLTEYKKGVSMTFEKFNGYYAADDVRLKKLEVDFYPDGQARTNALLNGDVQLIDYVPWENFSTIKANKDLVLDSQPGTFMYLVANTTQGPFKNAKVREAVAFAVNRKKIVQGVFSGSGKVLTGIPIPEASPFYNPSKQHEYSYDPAKAKALLREAGYPNGFSAKILATSQYAFHQDTAISVQADLKAVGINLTVDAPDWATRIQKGTAGQYDIAVNGTGGNVNDPTFLSDLLIGPANYRRPFGYQDDKVSQLLAEGVRTLNEEKRKNIYDTLQDQLAATAPIIPLTTREQGFAYSKRVTGFKNLPGFTSFYSGYTLAKTDLTTD